MDVERKPHKIRFISGPPALVDAQVNELLEEYVVAAVNYASTTEGVIVTCYLVLQSEVRKMAIASAGPMPGRGH